MSIFKSTFSPYVSRQLLARQHLLQAGAGGGERTRNVQTYTSGKTAWARMTSLVDYQEQDNGPFTDALARKYVLQAGTLYNTDSGFKLRGGLGTSNGAYGGNLGTRTSKTDKRPLGYRPMPGIVSIDTVNKGAFGSLRQSTIKFKAWDKPQLDDLEVLFMRPGYWVVLEWGWSMYMNTYETEDYKKKPDAGTIHVNLGDLNRYINQQMVTFDAPTINAFDTNLNLESILDKMEFYRHQFSGNYDGLLGRIENFTFELMPDGSYDCTTILISIGDVLDSLKMNRPPRWSLEGQEQAKADEGYKTNFAKTMSDFINMDVNTFVATNLDGLKDVPQGYDNEGNTDLDPSNAYRIVNSQGSSASPSAGQNTKDSSDSITYIQFAYLVYILNIKHNYYDTKGNKLINIQIPLPTKDDPNVGLCLASVDSVSIDPLKVLVHNRKATFITGLEGGFDLPTVMNKVVPLPSILTPAKPDYTIPTPFNTTGASVTQNALGYSQVNISPKSFLVEKEPEGHSLGYIGNIYVSVQHIKDKFEDMISKEGSAGKGEVGIYSFLKEILSDMSYALGSINDFDISPQDNIIHIIDKNYCERAVDTHKDKKFMLNIYGNNTLTRAFKIYSKIFQSQATEIAIGAQYTTNLGGVYAATQRQFNQHLRPRIYYKLATQEEKTPATATLEEQKQKELEFLAQDVINIRQYLQAFLNTGVFPAENTISTANTYLKTALIQVNSDSNFRAPMPLYLEVTLDGISGMVIGQIFTVNTDILPDDYARNAMGFMVTSLSHHMKGSDWTTVVGTKPVLLNQDSLGSPQAVNDLKRQVGLTIINKENVTLTQSLMYVQAYLRIMCFVKLYFDQKLDVSALVTRDLPQDAYVLSYINETSIDPTVNPTVKVSIGSLVMLTKGGVTPSTVLYSSHINVISYSNVKPLLGEFLARVPTKDNRDLIVAFVNSISGLHNSDRTDVIDEYKRKRRIDKQSSSISLNTLSYKLNGDDSFFINILKSLSDYTGLPADLKKLAENYLSEIAQHTTGTKVTIPGITVQQTTGNTITYVEDASQGSITILE
jgi:hypothetical protein